MDEPGLRMGALPFRFGSPRPPKPLPADACVPGPEELGLPAASPSAAQTGISADPPPFAAQKPHGDDHKDGWKLTSVLAAVTLKATMTQS